MKKSASYLAHAFTPPAFILNIYSLVVENLNVFLLIAISAATLVFWCVSIKTNKVQRRRAQAELAAAEAQERYYEQLSKNLLNKKE